MSNTDTNTKETETDGPEIPLFALRQQMLSLIRLLSTGTRLSDFDEGLVDCCGTALTVMAQELDRIEEEQKRLRKETLNCTMAIVLSDAPYHTLRDMLKSGEWS